MSRSTLTRVAIGQSRILHTLAGWPNTRFEFPPQVSSFCFQKDYQSVVISNALLAGSNLNTILALNGEDFGQKSQAHVPKMKRDTTTILMCDDLLMCITKKINNTVITTAPLHT